MSSEAHLDYVFRRLLVVYAEIGDFLRLFLRNVKNEHVAFVVKSVVGGRYSELGIFLFLSLFVENVVTVNARVERHTVFNPELFVEFLVSLHFFLVFEVREFLDHSVLVFVHRRGHFFSRSHSVVNRE